MAVKGPSSLSAGDDDQLANHIYLQTLSRGTRHAKYTKLLTPAQNRNEESKN